MSTRVNPEQEPVTLLDEETTAHSYTGATSRDELTTLSGLSPVSSHGHTRHCGPTSASSRHMQRKLKTANGYQARHHRSRCAGAAICTVTGVRSSSRIDTSEIC